MPSGSKEKETAGSYNLKDAEVPRSAGFALSTICFLSEFGMTKGLVRGQMLKSAGVDHFRENVHPTEAPTNFPIHYTENKGTGKAVTPDEVFAAASTSGRKPLDNEFKYWSVADYHQKFKAGVVTPTAVAHKILEFIKQSNNATVPLRAVVQCDEEDVLRQAAASTERYKAGKPLSVFDGVPVAVKVELDAVPYGTTAGTKFLGKTPAEHDAFVVTKLRGAGAVLVGKSNMHEIGLGVTGGNTNPGQGFARNAYGFPNHYAGGSSGGSAAAVAAGLVPIAIGADGGGSVRLPSAFCGGVGLKCTFGRVSESGAYPLCWSVAHVGPMTATAADNALLYALIAGRDEHDNNSKHQPLPTLKGVFDGDSLEGLKIGVYGAWFEHADKEVVDICRDMLHKLRSKGASIVEITIPELEETKVGHAITIMSEMATSMDAYYDKDPALFTKETRAVLSLAQEFTARDYIKAQRQRTRAMGHLEEVFKSVDMIATPASGIPSPVIPSDSLAIGEVDIKRMTKITRFAGIGNYTGVPAITFVSGYTTGPSGPLPVALQLMGRPWEEHTLLKVAVVADRLVERKAPALFYDVLGRKMSIDSPMA